MKQSTIRHTFSLLVLCISISWVVLGWSLEMKTNNDSSFNNWILHFSGEIQIGDFDKFREFVVSNKYGLPVSIFIGNSLGGNISEALRIAQVITEGNITVIIAGPCASSCLFLVFAANDRQSFLTTFKVALHRPTYSSKEFSNLTQMEAQVAYQNLEQKVKAFLDSRKIPAQLVDLMFSTKSTDVSIMTAGELLDQIGMRDAAYEEWLLAKCGEGLTEEEQGVLWDEILEGVCPIKPQSYCEFLRKKGDEKYQCDYQATADARIKTYFKLVSHPEKFQPTN